MRVLITGVAGFLGSRLADWIIEHIPNVEVIGIDNLSGGYKENLHDLVEFFPVDILDDKIPEIYTGTIPHHSMKVINPIQLIHMELRNTHVNLILRLQENIMDWIGVL